MNWGSPYFRIIAVVGLVALMLLTVAGRNFAAQSRATATVPSTSRSIPAPETGPFTKAHALREAEIAWQQSMAAKPKPGRGCFHAEYPSATWKVVRCHPPSRVPQRIGSDVIRRFTVGNKQDWIASVPSGTISSMTGSFGSVNDVRTITPGQGSASNFSLQLNTNQFTIAGCNKGSACSTCTSAVRCKGWVQFTYSNTGNVYIEYSMVNFNSSCPQYWLTYFVGTPAMEVCFFNTPMTPVPVQKPTNLANLTLAGGAAAGGNDEATVAVSPTSLYSLSYDDNVVDLSQSWTAAEYAIVGDGGGSNTRFNAGASIGVRMIVNAASAGTVPVCSTKTFGTTSFTGWTAETNNLNLKNYCNTLGSSIGFTEALTPLVDYVLTPSYTPTSGPFTHPFCPPSGCPTGPAIGGTSITLIGSGFTGATSVMFGRGVADPVPVPAFTIVSDTAITTTNPPCSATSCWEGSTGELVTVSGPAGSDTSVVGFIPYASVTRVDPPSGTPGTKVTVTGDGFETASFLFSGVAAQDVDCSGFTLCTMTVPAGAPNPADVRNTGNFTIDGLSPKSAGDEFVYTGDGAPTITGVDPPSGSTDGGTQITITGTNFTQAMEAAFGTFYIGITGDCPTSTQCTFQTPRWTGVTLVDISVGGYAAGSLFSALGSADKFSYTAPPASGELSPGFGIPAGNTPVMAVLNNFAAPAGFTAIDFDFNGNITPASDVVCAPALLEAGSSVCTFNTPPLMPPGEGPVAVPVTIVAGGNSLSVGNFFYQQPSPSPSPSSRPPKQTPCQICREAGGICETVNGRFFCKLY